MAQGIFGGATNYDDQSLEEILRDIQSWINYTNKTKDKFEKDINVLREANYWGKIPFNFQMTLLSSVRCQRTFLDDLTVVSNAIQHNQVSEREVKLMIKIGKNAIEYNHEYGKTYKEEHAWKDYGNENFKIVEGLYGDGRDYFVTMQDASNISSRLSDYISATPPVVNNNVTQTINGHRNVVAGINTGTINISEMNITNYSDEFDDAIDEINKNSELSEEHKSYVNDILDQSKKAISNGDMESQSQSKTKMEGFLMGLGNKANIITTLLANYTNIATYFGFNATN